MARRLLRSRRKGCISTCGLGLMRWYVNDASLQAQHVEPTNFERTLRDLLRARARVSVLKQNLRTTRSLPEAVAVPGVTVRQFLQHCRDRDLRSAAFAWLDQTGPFVEDEQLPEHDDYFEYED